MKLKQYQAESLSVLRRFFEEARVAGPGPAYEGITQEADRARRLGRYGGSYSALEGLPTVPYVCLRLPTGGGKTRLGAHSIAIARDTWVEKDYPLVLWLTPSNTIRLQTVETLKNARHPYRGALNEAFDGRVRVFDIADFADVRPQDIRDNLCIVVGTIQTLRVSNTEGRKVYAHNEDLEPHFAGISAGVKELERLDEGGIKYSFANLMHLHRPLMIVDEAHNAVTGLTREMQARVNPCAIIEFTATPRERSNILHNVSAQELKQEEMIKLPIILSEHDSWQNAVNGAVAARASLRDVAERDPSYIRPIVLFQAQPKNQEVTVEVLRKHLIEVENIPEERIATATGDQRELDGIDLFDPNCPIEYVITIQALKEGWDCSFAYVFCSVSRIGSATDVEQLLGRVLRMPYATRRPTDELNRAYAFLSEPTFGNAARALAEKLVAMGFEQDEARENIEAVQVQLDDEEGFWRAEKKIDLGFTHSVSSTPELLSTLSTMDPADVTVREAGDGRVVIILSGAVDSETERSIIEKVPESERSAFVKALSMHRSEQAQSLAPADHGKPFRVPRLMSRIQGNLEFADSDTFLEFHEWSLLDYAPELGEGEFTVRETARTFEIDLDGNRITYQLAGELEQLGLDIEVEGWTPEALVLWLDRQVRQPDIRQSDLLRWLTALVHHLSVVRGMHISALMRCKFILARKVRERLETIQRTERTAAYQKYLFDPGARVEVSNDDAFAFKTGMYRDLRRYRGRWRPSKHFLGPDEVPAFDGADDGEEVQCAQAIDSLSQVVFWIRNVARHPDSFYLPVARGRFYPDFVALLEDGRHLVVEYKGEHLADGIDTQEKRTVGLLWERHHKDQGVFLIVEKAVGGKDMREQILSRLL